MLLPSLLAALRQVVPSAHAAFFYCDDQANILNLYAERMLPPEAMARYHELYFRSDVSAFAQGYLARVAAADPVSRHTVTEAERQSGYYRDVLSPMGIEHILYGIVRHGGRALGQLSLYRDATGPEFSREDEQSLRDILHYPGRALASTAPRSKATTSTLPEEEAVVVLDGTGSIRFADANWDRLARMARGQPIAPGSARAEAGAIRSFTSAVLLAARASSNASHTIESSWGRFSFRLFEMQDADGSAASALLVSRMAMEPVCLAEGAALLELTPQQREVALMLTQGMSNQDIAERLGISINTANFHVKKLFLRLGVHERQQIATVLLAATVARPAG